MTIERQLDIALLLLNQALKEKRVLDTILENDWFADQANKINLSEEELKEFVKARYENNTLLNQRKNAT